MHKSAMEFPSDDDEFEKVGLEKAPSEVVRPPRVALAPISMECSRFNEVGAAPCEALMAKTDSEKIGGQSCVSAIAVREWMDRDEAMVKRTEISSAS